MADNESTIPVTSDSVTVYAVAGMTFHDSAIPAVANSLTMYAPQSDVTLQDSSTLPAAVCNVTVTPPLSYTEETVTEGCYTAWVYLGGVDVTEYLIGEIQITEQETASTLANFDLVFGPTIEPGQAVQVVVYDGSNIKALFVGVLSTSEPKPDSGEVQCSATTDLQNRVRDLTDDELDGLIGGYWHKEISRTEGDQWERAKELLETVPAEIHIDHGGNLVKAVWAAKDTADKQYTNATRYTKTLRGTVAQKGGIVNRNLVTVQHRFNRRKLRTISCGWACPDSFAQLRAKPWALPNKDAVTSALDGCGWEHRGIVFTPPWHTYHIDGKYVYVDPAQQFVVNWSEELVIGFSAKLSTTWDQTIINTLIFDVKSNTSIAAIGERGVEEQWGISEEYEEEVQEEERQDGYGAVVGRGSQIKGTAVINSAYGQGDALELEYGQQLSNDDWYVDDISAKTDLDGAILTAINRGTTEILSSHREHSEYFEVPFSHDNQLSNTTRLVGDVTCKGKNRSLVHAINPTEGYAYTVIEVAISGMEGQGTDTPDPLEPTIAPVNDPLGSSDNISLQTFIGGEFYSPPRPSSGISAVFSDYEWSLQTPYDNDWVADVTEVNTYGRSVEIQTPEIGAGDVDDREQDVNQTVVVDVPVDEYTLDYTGAC